ncbi:MAG TPA: DUF1854 domain-containing protein [Burkholderiaceae bacterium]|jgi:hypothetical protein
MKTIVKTSAFNLERNSFGRLVLTAEDGQVYEAVAPVRAFPIQTPDEGIGMVCPDGREVAWIEKLSDLAPPVRALVEEELQSHEFMPEISHINGVTSFATPCTWSVRTDRGDTDFVLRGEEDIRRIGRNMLLIADNHGIHFLIRDLSGLDKHSRKILDRFL